MFAAIDLGSNSFRLHIGEYDGATMRIIKSARNQVNLAAGLDAKGYLTDTAMQTALSCLSEFYRLLATFPIEAVRVVATNTLRIAKNADQFLPLAEKMIGHPIEVISGEEEGRLIYMGVSNAEGFTASTTSLVIDIGGGSTEVILGRNGDIEQVESFSIGTHPQRMAFFEGGVLSEQAFDAAITSARACFEDAVVQFTTKRIDGIYGSSGTIRALGVALEKNRIGDGSLSYANLVTLKKQLVSAGHIDRVVLDGIKPERLIVMVSGLSIMLGMFQEFCLGTMQTTVAGLRMGILWDLQLRSMQHDRRDQAIAGLMRKFHVDEKRAKSVAAVAVAFYHQLQPSHFRFEKCLYWAGLLHEIGLCLSHSNVHKHSAYMADNADLPGFTKREQQLMSALVLGQKGNLKKLDKTLADIDVAKAVLALRLATMCLHAKMTEQAKYISVDMHHAISLHVDAGLLALHPTLPYWLSKEQDHWRQIDVTMTVHKQ